MISTRRTALFALLAWAPLASQAPGERARPADPALVALAPIAKSHCAKCHSADDPEADVNLTDLREGDLAKDPELLQTLIDVLDYQEMPPEDEPQLADEDRLRLVAALKAALGDHASEATRYAHTPIRRMTRFQYNNAVVDLFDLKRHVFSLPERMMREYGAYFDPANGRMPDVVHVGSRPLGKSQMIEPQLAGVVAYPQDLRAEHGFDNRGDHLSLSPLLMESFLKLGRSITTSRDFTAETVGQWQAIFAAPAENPVEHARQRITALLTRAFRRDVESEETDRYANFVVRQLDAGVPFTAAMKSVAAAVIASPQFFYLFDRPAESEFAEQLDGFELASRLSFFLWGSIPDAELLELARSGQLTDSEALENQIDRLLSDRKLKRFCDSFPSQWLQLDRIVSARPDRAKFPGFYFAKYRDSMHMMLEPLLVFETVLVEDRPITQLIDPDFTYRSGLLEQAYAQLGTPKEAGRAKGGQAVSKIAFQRVPITDRRAGGIITNAAVMTMTSGPERTKPITRGAWLAAVIFNDPPEPPPADVPPLAEQPAHDEKQLTLRERLTLHRERADCRGCHETIDPLGFALENYNPIGVWRDRYENGRDVDMSGKLMRRPFGTVVEFKDAILEEKDRFTTALAGHLLSYGLARELTAADRPALQSITTSTAADGYRMRTLLKQVILSEPFRTKSNPR